MQAKKEWRFLPHDAGRIDRLARECRISPVVAQLLVSRGVYEPADVRRFLQVKMTDLHDPKLLPGAAQAAEQLYAAARGGEKIVIYGDYDADGMTATGILLRGLRLLGADVSYFIPNRLEDGYGLSGDALRNLASQGKQLVVTVDCGIASVAEAALCRELGLRLIVTDHHQFGAEMPSAEVLVHPRLPNSQYPFGDLCGAGVAFKLLWALFQLASGADKVTDAMRDHLLQSLSLAAIGTVADVVPLVNENRAIVTHGLRTLKDKTLPGLAELLRVTNLDKKAVYSAEDIGFTLAPRLNAAGRLGQAQLGVELLTTTNPQRAAALADYLHQLNASRESLERSVYLSAQKQAKETFHPFEDAALVLAGTGWHAGVIGVVAGRLAERYAKPVAIVSIDSMGGKLAVGSARAGCDINLHEALLECNPFLASCGGHAAAAGFKIEPAHVDRFRDHFCDAVQRQQSAVSSAPRITIDAETSLGQLNLETVQQLESMAPFGNGNPRPVLCACGIELADAPKKMGAGEKHLSVRLKQGTVMMRAVAFGQAEWADLLAEHEGPIDIAFKPVINDFNGYRSVEGHLVDWRPSRRTAPIPA